MVMTVSAASAPSRSPGGGGRRTASPAASRRCRAAGWPAPGRRRRRAACRQATTSSRVEVSSAGTWRTACRSSVAVDASRATCGGTSIEQMSCTSMRRSARALETAISYSRSPAGAGGELGAQRRRDQRVRRERALLGAGQVEHPGVRPQLRHRRTAGPAGRTGRAGSPGRRAGRPGSRARRAGSTCHRRARRRRRARPERSRTSIGKCRSRKTGRRQVPAVRPIRSPRRSPTVDAAWGSAAASSLTGIRRR